MGAKASIEKINSKEDIEWMERMCHYEKYITNLRIEKQKFILDNPGFPKDTIEIMFRPIVDSPTRFKINILT